MNKVVFSALLLALALTACSQKAAQSTPEPPPSPSPKVEYAVKPTIDNVVDAVNDYFKDNREIWASCDSGMFCMNVMSEGLADSFTPVWNGDDAAIQDWKGTQEVLLGLYNEARDTLDSNGFSNIPAKAVLWDDRTEGDALLRPR